MSRARAYSHTPPAEASPRKRRPMTDKQRQVFAFIRQRIASGLGFPTRRAIAAHMGTSVGGADAFLNALSTKGYLRRPRPSHPSERLRIFWELVA